MKTPPKIQKRLEQIVQGMSENGPQGGCEYQKAPKYFKHFGAEIKNTRRNPCGCLSSFIQTILSASELHRIMPFGSWALPPVGNHTLP